MIIGLFLFDGPALPELFFMAHIRVGPKWAKLVYFATLNIYRSSPLILFIFKFSYVLMLFIYFYLSSFTHIHMLSIFHFF